MAISNADHDRRARLLAKSQSTLDDIDNVVDNKPLPRNEAVEASLTKQWGPDPDPVDPDNPTIFRFQRENDLRNPGGMRVPEAMGRTSGEYVLENNDRYDRMNMFGSTEFTPYRNNEIYIDEDGPLHGLAKPIYESNKSSYNSYRGVHEREQMYMSREEKRQLREAPQPSARTSPARSRTLNRNPTGSQRLPIRQAAQRAIEGNHARAGGSGTGNYSFRTSSEIDTNDMMDRNVIHMLHNSDANHVIYSYKTPIAWSEGEGENRVWTVPHKKHSRTTTRHQSAIRSALWNGGYVPDEAQETPEVAIFRRGNE